MAEAKWPSVLRLLYQMSSQVDAAAWRAGQGDSGRYLESHAIPQRWNNESLLPKSYQLLVICRLTDYWS